MAESSQLGIKTESDLSDAKFMRFFDIVQDAASKIDRVFFLDCGEGHELETETLSGEDLFGWCVKKEDVEKFIPLWLEGWDAIEDDWEKDEAFARWSHDDNRVVVSFEFVMAD